jgi:hypothetical protein
MDITCPDLAMGGLNIGGGVVLLGKPEGYKREIFRETEMLDVV